MCSEVDISEGFLMYENPSGNRSISFPVSNSDCSLQSNDIQHPQIPTGPSHAVTSFLMYQSPYG